MLGLVLFAALVTDPALTVQPVASGFIAPTGMAFIGDDDILVIQQLDGTVLRVVGGTVMPDPVLDLPVDAALLDRGLLGIALDPDFANNRFVYVNYVLAAQDGGEAIGIRVERYRWNGAAPVEARPVMSLGIRPNIFRIGGVILFGPDDRLYTVTGDQQQLGKLQNVTNGANPDDTSSILRTHADGVFCSDNPFPLGSMLRYWAYGIRNSFGMAFDPVTGDLWDTENGQEGYDEINRVVRGLNSGWVWLQGPDARDPDSPRRADSAVRSRRPRWATRARRRLRVTATTTSCARGTPAAPERMEPRGLPSMPRLPQPAPLRLRSAPCR